MTQIKKFTFNPFQENTYLLYDKSMECVVIDPGNSNAQENIEIAEFIESESLELKLVLNTHCHIDHVLGNAYFHEKYGLKPWIHEKDLVVLHALTQYGEMFGVPVNDSPEPQGFLNEGKSVRFGNTELEVMHIPGHAPGHVVFINRNDNTVIGGDVLFYGSIGRTDLPYGDHETLIQSIKKKLFALSDDFEVHPGHGPKTTIGFERKNNPFLQS
ncbi:MAG: MBL fold metallo-hydrolase [Vicingaceae bacterium]